MHSSISGSCNCGAVSFEAAVDPAIELCCHCTDCRDATKQPYAKLAFFKKDTVEINGDRASRVYVAESGSKTAREYCEHCGVVLFDTSEGFPRLIGVMVDNIKPPFEFKPACHVWVRSKIPEVVIKTGMKIYEQGITT